MSAPLGGELEYRLRVRFVSYLCLQVAGPLVSSLETAGPRFIFLRRRD